MFFGLFWYQVDMVFGGVGIIKILDKNAGQIYMLVVALLTWGQFKFFIKWIFVSHKIFVYVVQIDVAFHLVDDESDPSEGFVKIVVVSDVANGVEDPS